MGNTSDIQLSMAGIEDVGTIRELAFDIWPVAYKNMISKDQIAYMLNQMYSPESLKHQMMNEHSRFILARRGEKNIGFASYSEVRPQSFKLHKLYVLTSEHRSGCGRMLLTEIEHLVKSAGGISLELQVNKQNPAVAFYEKMGYQKINELVLDIGSGFVMDDFLMHKSIH